MQDEHKTREQLIGEIHALREQCAAFHEAEARQRQSEEALRASEERFRILFDCSPDAIFLIDPSGPGGAWQIVDCNEVACRMNGYTRQELIGQDIHLLSQTPFDPEPRHHYLEKIRQLGTIQSQSIHRRKDGTLVPVEFSTSLINLGDRDLLLSIDRDITERTHAEKELRESEKRFRLVARASNDVIWDWDLTTQALWWNEGFQEIFGYRPEEIEPGIDSWSTRLHPDDQERVLHDIHEVIERGTQMWTGEYRFRRSDGTYAVVMDRGFVVRDPHERPIRMIGSMVDVTERKQAERRNAVFQALGQQLNAATTAVDAAHIIAATADELLSWDAFFLNLYVEATDTVTDVLNMDIVDGRRAVVPLVDVDRPPGAFVRQTLLAGAQLFSRADAEASVGLQSFGDTERASESLMFVPIRSDAHTIGILSIQSYTPQAYTRDDLATLQALADQCAGALERIWAAEALRESEERFRLLFEHSPDAIWLLDLPGPDGSLTILECNLAAAAMHGYTRDEIVGQPIGMFVVLPDDPERFRRDARGQENFRRDGVDHGEDQHRRKDGTVITIEYVARRVTLNGRDLVLAVERDITAYKHAEEERERLIHELQLARDLAEQASRAKSEFLRTMSHELRTPLFTILGYAELMTSDRPKPEHQEYLTYISSAGEHLLALVNDLLDISRIEAGGATLLLQPTTIAAVVQDSLQLVRRQAAERGISIHVQHGPDEQVLADPQRLHQVLVNLLSNAVKYNVDGGHVSVTWTRRDGRVRISVQDTGAGIPASLVPRLFTPFERLGADKSAVPGSGLGLALSKQLVEGMGGTIGVDSEEGQGTTFWAELPGTS